MIKTADTYGRPTYNFGRAGIAGMYQKCPEPRAIATLQAGCNAGIRYFDSAPHNGTGLSEQRLGQFLESKPCDEVKVSTEVGRLLTPVSPGMAADKGFVGALPALVHFDYSHDGIVRSVGDSLMRLGLTQIDIQYVMTSAVLRVGLRHPGIGPTSWAEGLWFLTG